MNDPATAPAAEPVHTVTVNGTAITTTMTPLQRHNAIAATLNLPSVARPAGATFGPPGHPHVQVPDEATARAMTGIAGKAPPPSPQQLERQNSGDKLADFNKEMQQRGLQRRPEGTTHADGQPNLEAAEKLTERYRQLRETLKGPKAEQELRQAFERDMKRLLEGRPLSETELKLEEPKRAKGAKSAGKDASLSQPVTGQHHRQLTDAGRTLQDGLLAELRALPKAEQSDPGTRDKYAAALVSIRANEHGNVSVEHFNADSLHGYTLPRFLPDQHYAPSIIFQLAAARKAGVSQQQVDAFIRAEMQASGWIR